MPTNKPTRAQWRAENEARREAAKRPPVPIAAPSFDARHASPDDIARRYAQLGLDPSSIERHLTPPKDPAAQRAARQALDRIERDRMRTEEARAAAINAGSAFDGRTATDEEVRARMQSLGIDTTTLITRQDSRPVVPTAEDRVVASKVRKALQAGKHVDVSKLSAGERLALNEQGNADGYGAPGGGTGLGY